MGRQKLDTIQITFVDKDDPRRGEAHERLGSICCKIYRVQLLGKQKITGKEMVSQIPRFVLKL